MNASMKRARTSGELARQAGRPIEANPYRMSSSTRSPRRGSWSEAFARQWALGWKEIDEQLQSQPAPAVPGPEFEEVIAHPTPPSVQPPLPAKQFQTSHSPKGDSIHG